jgi:phosphoglycerate dehydrogenase-like enzyme
MKDIKILLSISELDDAFSKMVESLKEYASVDVVDLQNYNLADYDIFIGKKLSKSKLDEANKLKYIFAYKTGVDDFPLAELEKMGVVLINSHADSRIIAEYAFGLSVALVNRINEFDLNLRQGIWYDNERRGCDNPHPES